MARAKKKNPLANWRKTTLWHRVLNGPLVKTNVWHPRDVSDDERVALLAKHASQTVTAVRQLTGSSEMIVQGQYKDEPTTPEPTPKTERVPASECCDSRCHCAELAADPLGE